MGAMSEEDPSRKSADLLSSAPSGSELSGKPAWFPPDLPVSTVISAAPAVTVAPSSPPVAGPASDLPATSSQIEKSHAVEDDIPLSEEIDFQDLQTYQDPFEEAIFQIDVLLDEEWNEVEWEAEDDKDEEGDFKKDVLPDETFDPLSATMLVPMEEEDYEREDGLGLIPPRSLQLHRIKIPFAGASSRKLMAQPKHRTPRNSPNSPKTRSINVQDQVSFDSGTTQPTFPLNEEPLKSLKFHTRPSTGPAMAPKRAKKKK